MDALLWVWAYVLAIAVQSDSTIRRLLVSWAYPSPPLVFYLITLYLSGFVRRSKYHETNYGSAWTTLYNIKDLVEHQHPACNKNDLLVIGNGLNGDLLTINLRNNHIAYVFHDDLWEENYLNIEDVYCELPFDIEVFLNMVLEGKTYPIDGTMAEKMKLFF